MERNRGEIPIPTHRDSKATADVPVLPSPWFSLRNSSDLADGQIYKKRLDSKRTVNPPPRGRRTSFLPSLSPRWPQIQSNLLESIWLIETAYCQSSYFGR